MQERECAKSHLPGQWVATRSLLRDSAQTFNILQDKAPIDTPYFLFDFSAKSSSNNCYCEY